MPGQKSIYETFLGNSLTGGGRERPSQLLMAGGGGVIGAEKLYSTHWQRPNKTCAVLTQTEIEYLSDLLLTRQELKYYDVH
jgi:hypothetical protein